MRVLAGSKPLPTRPHERTSIIDSWSLYRRRTAAVTNYVRAPDTRLDAQLAERWLRTPLNGEII